jgi:hypothetical protein
MKMPSRSELADWARLPGRFRLTAVTAVSGWTVAFSINQILETHRRRAWISIAGL